MSIDDWFAEQPEIMQLWGRWKKDAECSGILVIDDDSGYEDDSPLNKTQAQAAMKCATVRITAEPTHKRIQDWAAEYDELMNNPPTNGDYLQAVEGRVKLDIIKELGKQPFISTRAYVPEVVGAKLGWFVTGETEIRTHGWRVVLATKSRETAFKKFGVSADFILVKNLRVLRIANDGMSIIAEVAEW